MITQLSDRVYSIDVPLPGNPLRNLNSFLIKGDRRNLLVDTGFNMPECFDAITIGLVELDIDIEKTDILLTHLHSDHVGLASAIAGKHSNVYISSTDFEILKSFDDPDYISMLDGKFLEFGLSKKEIIENKTVNPAMIYLPTREINYKLIDDGFIIDLGGCVLECILTPGHTPGHICLYDRRRKIFFTGDHILFGISPNITSWPSMEDSLGAYLNSLERVRKFDVERAFSAHRNIEGDFQTRIDELITHHRERLDEAESVVRKTKKATVYDTAAGMSWSIHAKSWDDFPVAQKWFALGEAHSHLEYLRVRNIIASYVENGLIYYVPVLL